MFEDTDCIVNSREIYFLPWDPQTWYPVVLTQMAVNEAVEVMVEVDVIVVVPKAKYTRP